MSAEDVPDKIREAVKAMLAALGEKKLTPKETRQVLSFFIELFKEIQL